ncbi:uncharacterized protein LOC113278659 [Papaver somniferum]|uniref:uncharacterized protein LOC113278659 n=1 Tax=Papaver somniferum TaxID=3469 RepID=UPI000E704C03|nr:uncharacterized protein LOC113278659 [Papaver somniferum]
MKTQAETVRIQTLRKRQQRNQLRRTANLLQQESNNLVFHTDSSLWISSEITSDKAPAKSDESDIPSQLKSSASNIVEFADDSTLSFEVINSTVNGDGAESAEESEGKMKIDLLERYGTDSDRLNSLLKIGGTSIEDDIDELMCKKAMHYTSPKAIRNLLFGVSRPTLGQNGGYNEV